MASGDGFECGLEMNVGLDAVEFAGLDINGIAFNWAVEDVADQIILPA
jgi:hypothetical protein